MSISQKIIDKVNAANVTEEERNLMREILAIEDEGNFRYDAAYEKVIKIFIASVEDNGGTV